jgi:hypothetical protein
VNGYFEKAPIVWASVINGNRWDGIFLFQKHPLRNRNHRELSNGKINYFHSALTPVIVHPGNKTVITLEPEFIVPQDGHEK